MDTLQCWPRLSLALCAVLLGCFPLLMSASPVPREQHPNASCSLKRAYINPAPSLKQHIGTLSEQAKERDHDTDTSFFGKHLFSDINENYHCHLMKQVLDFTVKDLLHLSTETTYPNIQEVRIFLRHIQYELQGCEEDEQPFTRNNLEELKNKVKELGESAQNKAIGELRILLQCLKDACTTRN